MTNDMINIDSAAIVRDYEIRLNFDDGTSQVIDFEPFLQRASHPQIRAFLDSRKFGDFRIVHGELVWGDYELCFPMMDLYTNRIVKRSQLEPHA